MIRNQQVVCSNHITSSTKPLEPQGLHPTGVQSEPGGSKHGTEKRISAAGQNALPLISFLFGKGVSNLTGGYCWQTPSRGTLRCTRTLPMWV